MLATSGSGSRTEYAAAAVVQDGAILDAGDTGGTTTAYTATLAPAIAAYADKQLFRVKFNATCGATPTINFNAVGAKKMYRLVGTTATQITTNGLSQNFVGLLRYDAALDSAAGAFWVVNLALPASQAEVDAGTDATKFVTPATLPSTLNASTATALPSATSVSITVPSGVREVVVTLLGASLSGATELAVTLGDAGGEETSGYLGSGFQLNNGSLITGTAPTSEWRTVSGSAAATYHGTIRLTRMTADSLTWICSGNLYRSDAATGDVFGGSKSTSAAMTTIILKSSNGSSTFDAGSYNAVFIR